MYYDRRNKTKEKRLEVGDEIMLQQQKTTTRSPFDPDTYKVKEIKGSSVVAERRGRELLRAKNLIKVVKQRPEYLKEVGKEKMKKIVEEDIDIDMDKIRRRVAETEETKETEDTEEDTIQGVEGAGQDGTAQLMGDKEEKGSISGDSDDSRFTITYDDQEDRVEEVGHQITQSGRVVVPPDRFRPDTTTERPRLSPRERKRRQSMRKKEKKMKKW